jgi:hypothetical protein
MFRIATIVFLSAATVLTGVGWVCSHVCEHSVGGLLSSTGWSVSNFLNHHHSKFWPIYGACGELGVFTFSAVDARPWAIHGSIPNFEWGQLILRSQLYPTNVSAVTQGLLVVRFPFSIPFLLFGIYPGLTLLKRVVIPYRRRRAGKCVACGYSLIGNESGTCPECGAAK